MHMKKYQRIVASILTLSMCCSMSAFAAEPTNDGSVNGTKLNENFIEDIRTEFEVDVRENDATEVNDYYSMACTGIDVLNVFDSLSNSLMIMYDSGDLNMTEYETVSQNIQEARNDRLDELGENYYILTRDNVDEIESELKTDFSQIGLDFSGEDAESSFLILLEGQDTNSDISTQSTIGSTTTYTYNGTTYYLRMMTFTSADYSSYAKLKTENLLTNKTANFVKSLLGSQIMAIIGSMSTNVGRISELINIAVGDFGAQGSDTYLNATLGASWRRVYRQVWNTSTSTWVYGSSVECAACTWALNGFLYNSTSAKYESKSNSGSFTSYSSNYYVTSWQCEKAVLGYINGRIYYDKTGSVSYNFGTSKSVTLSEPAA